MATSELHGTLLDNMVGFIGFLEPGQDGSSNLPGVDQMCIPSRAAAVLPGPQLL